MYAGRLWLKQISEFQRVKIFRIIVIRISRYYRENDFNKVGIDKNSDCKVTDSITA
jgi:hypothetical protein